MAVGCSSTCRSAHLPTSTCPLAHFSQKASGYDPWSVQIGRRNMFPKRSDASKMFFVSDSAINPTRLGTAALLALLRFGGEENLVEWQRESR
jgi:hypothetical protein